MTTKTISPVTKEIESKIKNNSVYHVTTKENAENILKHDYFRVTPGTIGVKGLSTTFDPNYKWGGGNVRFVLDYEKLKHDYPLKFVDEKIGVNESEIKVVSDSAILNASKYIKEVVKAQTEYHKFNYQIQWIRPTFKNEINEYFKNSDTQKYLADLDINFSSEDELIEFLKTGNYRQIPRSKLINTVQNMDVNDKTFKAKLTDAGYARSFYEMQKKLERYGRLTLESPILLSHNNSYYKFSGNRRSNIAFKYELPIRFWVVDIDDYLKSKTTAKLNQDVSLFINKQGDNMEYVLGGCIYSKNSLTASKVTFDKPVTEEEAKKLLIERAKKEQGKIFPTPGKKSLWDSFTEDMDMLIFWYNKPIKTKDGQTRYTTSLYSTDLKNIVPANVKK